MKISEQLDGNPIDNYKGLVTYDPKTGVYTFPDGSKAIALTQYKDSSVPLTTRYLVWKMKW